MSELNKKLGILLKDERERQKIELDDLSERLKISQQNLQTIESGSFEGLPSELYFSLFAKSYAEALGIDFTRTVDAIKIDIEENEQDTENSKNNSKKQTNKDSNESESDNSFLKKGGIALAVIVGLLLIYFVLDKFYLSQNSADSTNSDLTEITNQEDSNNKKALDEAYANYNWENKEYDKTSKIGLTLIPREESWSTVLTDGDTSIYRILRVGRTYYAEADYRMLVSIGIPSVVTIKLNGQEIDLRNSESRRISRVLINQINIDSFLNQQEEVTSEVPAEQELTTVSNKTKPIVQTADTVSNDDNESN